MTELRTKRVFLGLDLGQVNDYTALVGLRRLEEVERIDEYDNQRRAELALQRGVPFASQRGLIKNKVSRYECGLIERVPLGTSYPDIVLHVARLLRRPELEVNGHSPVLVLDRTGVGRAVFDLFLHAGLNPIAVTITAGNDAHPQDHGMSVPKRDLVAAVAVLLQTGRLKIAEVLPHAAELVRELLDFRTTISSSGHDSYNALRESAHDDLVLALGIAAWTAERYQSYDPSDFATHRGK